MGLLERQLAEEVLHSVKNGAFPDSEEVASTRLDLPSIQSLIDSLDTERENVKTEIRSLSRDSAPNIDEWVTQARKLQTDIERSKKTAREIVEQAEAGRQIQASVEDAASKVKLLEKELFFNETLADSIGKIQHIVGLLDLTQESLTRSDITLALEKIDEADNTLSYLRSLGDSRVLELLQNRSRQRKAVAESRTLELWNTLVKADPGSRKVVIRSAVEGLSTVTISKVAEALAKLDIFDFNITKLCNFIDSSIVAPAFAGTTNGPTRIVTFEAEQAFITEQNAPPTVHSAIENVKSVATYVSQRLPPPLVAVVSQRLAPKINQRLITNWLGPSLPTSIEEFGDFHKIVEELDQLADNLRSIKWSKCEDLADWKRDIPRHWLSKRKEKSLFAIREICIRGVIKRNKVERVETQMVSKDDIMVSNDGQDEDDWGDAWGDEPEESVDEPNERSWEQDDAGVDADTSAWGFEDDEQSVSKQSQHPEKEQEEDEADAWGWGEEDEDKAEPAKATLAKTKPQVQKQKPEKSERELTLREKYTVTSLPEEVMREISNVVFDAERLSETEFSSSPLAAAAGKLFAAPNLILAMYRAVASTYYVSEVAGNMLMYNDCSRLCDLLGSFLSDQSSKDRSSRLPAHRRPSANLKIEDDVKSLEGFGKRAYGKEMESQRTIIRDLLESAQNFENCTVQPFARECDNAISMTVDRIREVNNQWQDTLSNSARLQSLGSLLSTVITKMINDIEDMEDISEDQSQRLKHFCDEIANLKVLFAQTQDGGVSGDMTGIYTPNWFKFQYLSEILASSLADIKYLWTDSELKLEFRADEVTQLIKALFAESDYRRDAIKTIDKNASRW